jgi:trehalose/maltose hydrolase-like predicted phosphorylase
MAGGGYKGDQLLGANAEASYESLSSSGRAELERCYLKRVLDIEGDSKLRSEFANVFSS